MTTCPECHREIPLPKDEEPRTADSLLIFIAQEQLTEEHVGFVLPTGQEVFIRVQFCPGLTDEQALERGFPYKGEVMLNSIETDFEAMEQDIHGHS